MLKKMAHQPEREARSKTRPSTAWGRCHRMFNKRQGKKSNNRTGPRHRRDQSRPEKEKVPMTSKNSKREGRRLETARDALESHLGPGKSQSKKGRVQKKNQKGECNAIDLTCSGWNTEEGREGVEERHREGKKGKRDANVYLQGVSIHSRHRGERGGDPGEDVREGLGKK